MRYAELHCKTNFSFLQGASHADELVARAAELDYAALAVTDVNTLAGIVRAHAAAKTAGLKLIIGAEIVLEDASLGAGLPTPPWHRPKVSSITTGSETRAERVLLYATSFNGYGNLSSLITRGRRAAKKGECHLVLDDLADFAEDLIAAVTFSREAPASVTSARAGGSRLNEPKNLKHIFRDRCYLTASAHHGPKDDAHLEYVAHLAKQSRIPLLATNDVHYHDPSRRPLQDVLTAIRHGTTVADLGELRFPNGERYLKSPKQMAELFARYPDAIAHTIEIADRCSFSLDELRYLYPEELCPPGLTPTQHLTQLTWAGARERYPDGVPEKVAALIRRELSLIEELHYEAFFLTVWDLVKFARSRQILCQGRGSAANSVVCFCLGITSVDPDRIDVLFERFVSRERNEAPDIDVDFEHERREEVIQYIYQKYGRERAGIAAEVITYRSRSAVRDVGKALGLSLDRVDRLANTLDVYGDEEKIASRVQEAGLDPQAMGTKQLIYLVKQLLGFPRHLSQHVGGFVITGEPLSRLVPIENAAMPDRTFIEWDKDDLDTLGILKVDCLSLGMLTAIRKCFDLMSAHYGITLTLATVPAEDPDTYDMICKADTVGVFQIESRAQMAMLPRLKPRNFYDLVIEVSIVRPGPIQGDMVHPYLRRRKGEEVVTYPDASVESVLSKTLGVPLFQEQVMRLAMVTADFTPGEADQLRRAMGAWRRPGIIDQFRDKMRDRMLARGLPLSFAEEIFNQIRGFGEYGFPESHAASFALLAYVSAWMKCHYPAAFAAALINSQPMGFYAPAQIVRDAQEHGVEALPIDINQSDWDCTLEIKAPSPPGTPGGEGRGEGGRFDRLNPLTLTLSPGVPGERGLRLGFRLIKGFPEAAARAIVQDRQSGPFHSILNLARRVPIGRGLLTRLAAADAFRCLNLSRREALWQVLSLGEELPLFADLEEDQPLPALAEMPLDRQVVADYESIGLSLKAHPIGLLRAELNQLKLLPASSLLTVREKAFVRVGGLVLMRQRPATARGTIFMTLEDETGIVNLVVWKHVWERFRHIAAGAVALLVEGKLEKADGVIHVMATRVEDLTQTLQGLVARSRDFR